MKKRLFAAFVILCMIVSILPTAAFAIDAWPTDTDEIVVTTNGELDLSSLGEGPSSPITIVVKGNNATIIGNPNATFENVNVRFEFGTRYSKYTSAITVSIKDLNLGGQFSLKQYTEPSGVTINYSGACFFAGGFGTSSSAGYNAPIIYKAADENATLSLTGQQQYYNDVTFEGGTVDAVAVWVSDGGSDENSHDIAINDCELTFHDLVNNGLKASGDISISNSTVSAVHPDKIYSNSASGITAGGNINITSSNVTATGVVTSDGSASNGMDASPAIKSLQIKSQ